MRALRLTAEESVVGSLLGTAVGDAIGLPYEGLGRHRARRLLGPPDRHRLLLGRGMVSDDTEHSCMVASALARSGRDPDLFASAMGWALRGWLLALPAGVGLATLRASLRLWAGWSPYRSGVRSAGNGPAMRSAVLGAAVRDPDALRRLVEVSTVITHTDPKALHGALAVALAARFASGGGTVEAAAYCAEVERWVGDGGAELVGLLRSAAASATAGQSTPDYAASLGLERGVTGYVYHTVPVAIQAWLLRQHDFRGAVEGIVSCGGDADTTAAIVGGVVGASVGRAGIPGPWLDGVAEWPRSTAWMARLGAAAAGAAETGTPLPVPPYAWPAVLPRNLFFLAVVLGHGFRRALPPYR